MNLLKEEAEHRHHSPIQLGQTPKKQKQKQQKKTKQHQQRVGEERNQQQLQLSVMVATKNGSDLQKQEEEEDATPCSSSASSSSSSSSSASLSESKLQQSNEGRKPAMEAWSLHRRRGISYAAAAELPSYSRKVSVIDILMGYHSLLQATPGASSIMEWRRREVYPTIGFSQAPPR